MSRTERESTQPPQPDQPDQSDGPVPARTVAVVVAAVVVVCLGVLGYLVATDTDGDDSAGARLASLVTGEDRGTEDRAVVAAREREAVVRQATQFVLRSNTYGPGDLDEQNQLPGYAEGVRAVITAKQRAEFDQSLPLAVQTVAGAGYGRTCQVAAAGVEALEDDSATALVAGEIVGSYPDPQDPEQRIEDVPRQFRIKLTLRKVDGTWLVDTFAPVTGEAEADPAAPADPADPADPAAPTTGSTP